MYTLLYDIFVLLELSLNLKLHFTNVNLVHSSKQTTTEVVAVLVVKLLHIP